MEWHEISKKRPPHGELIWVWDKSLNSKFLIRYMGSEESWLNCKDNDNFPIWAYLNESMLGNSDSVEPLSDQTQVH